MPITANNTSFLLISKVRCQLPEGLDPLSDCIKMLFFSVFIATILEEEHVRNVLEFTVDTFWLQQTHCDISLYQHLSSLKSAPHSQGCVPSAVFAHLGHVLMTLVTEPALDTCSAGLA